MSLSSSLDQETKERFSKKKIVEKKFIKVWIIQRIENC